MKITDDERRRPVSSQTPVPELGGLGHDHFDLALLDGSRTFINDIRINRDDPESPEVRFYKNGNQAGGIAGQTGNVVIFDNQRQGRLYIGHPGGSEYFSVKNSSGSSMITEVAAAVVFSKALDMQALKVTNMADGTASDDAAAFGQIPTAVSDISAVASDYIAAGETTASTSYTDLATAGPAVTVTTGTAALVMLRCALANNTGGNRCRMGFAVSGATTIAAADAQALIYESGAADDAIQFGISIMVSADESSGALTAGSNTFTAKFSVDGGTGYFVRRGITVVPL